MSAGFFGDVRAPADGVLGRLRVRKWCSKSSAKDRLLSRAAPEEAVLPKTGVGPLVVGGSWRAFGDGAAADAEKRLK